jgi:hypothetical protein
MACNTAPSIMQLARLVRIDSPRARYPVPGRGPISTRVSAAAGITRGGARFGTFGPDGRRGRPGAWANG